MVRAWAFGAILLLGTTLLPATAVLSHKRPCGSKEACDVELQLSAPPKKKLTPIKIHYANITLDDGTTNFVMYVLPDTPNLGKLPTVIHYTPYPLVFLMGNIKFYDQALGQFKYAALAFIQLTGTGNSTGKFNGFQPSASCTLAGNKWVSKQPWSNGIISITGLSAMGIEGYLTHKNPDVGNTYRTRSAYIGIASADLKKDVYPGGAFRYCLVNDMTISLGQKPYKEVMMGHESPKDPFWEKTTLDISDYQSINSPTVHMASWLDVFLDGQMEAIQKYAKYSHAKVRPFHHVFVAPFGHCFLGGNIPYNQTAALIMEFMPSILEEVQVMIFNKTYSEFAFDAALGFYTGLLIKYKVPRYAWYVMGSGVPNNDGLGHFLTAGSAPPPTKKYSLFLDVQNGTLSEDRVAYNTSVDYIYDPQNPYPTIGGNNFDPVIFNHPGFPKIKPPPPRCGPWDQNLAGPRSDVVKLNGSALAEPLVVFGKNTVNLYVSSNCTDTDFVALLVDVFPNGTRLLIQQSQIRMRWRNMGAKPDPMTPGSIYQVSINLSHMAYIFRAGHRVGLDITSSTWPHVTVNPNTGAPLSAGMEGFKIAENTLYSGGVLDASLDLATTELSHIPVWYPDIPNIPHMRQEAAEFGAREI